MEENRRANPESDSTSIESGVLSQPTTNSLIDVDSNVDAQTAEPLIPAEVSSFVIHKQITPVTAQLVTMPDKTKDQTIERLDSQKPKSLPTIDELETLKTSDITPTECNKLDAEHDKIKTEKLQLEQTVATLRAKLQLNKEELEREVRRRVELEQRFTEEAKRTTDQIDELVAKSESDDSRFNELKKRFEQYSRETSTMIENFTTTREVLASQLLELRQENDYLLGKYLSKSRDLQSADINLPQTVEELQFHCLELYEKLILSTMAKERLQEILMQSNNSLTVESRGSSSFVSETPTSPQ